MLSTLYALSSLKFWIKTKLKKQTKPIEVCDSAFLSIVRLSVKKLKLKNLSWIKKILRVKVWSNVGLTLDLCN